MATIKISDTAQLKEKGITVAHVTANLKSALKCVSAGVDAIVAEGFEAGGHNGKEETTTLVLLQHLRKHVSIPLIAAGGFGSGQSIAAAQALGADGVQIGSLFAASTESSAHNAFKNKIIDAAEGDTRLLMKKLVPVRLLQNPFALHIEKAESEGASAEKISEMLGTGKAKAGMFEGDLQSGELEIGQISTVINEIKTIQQIFDQLIPEYQNALENLKQNWLP